MRAEIGKLVRFMYQGRVLPALIVEAEEGGLAYLKVFGRLGDMNLKAKFSEEFAEGKWSWAPQVKKP